VVLVNEMWVWSTGGMILTGESGSNQRKLRSSATFSTKFPRGRSWDRTPSAAVVKLKRKLGLTGARHGWEGNVKMDRQWVWDYIIFLLVVISLFSGSCEFQNAAAGSVKDQLRDFHFLKKDPACSCWNERPVSEIGMCFNSDVNQQAFKRRADEWVLKLRVLMSPIRLEQV
jgi:hypothetical protein